MPLTYPHSLDYDQLKREFRRAFSGFIRSERIALSGCLILIVMTIAATFALRTVGVHPVASIVGGIVIIIAWSVIFSKISAAAAKTHRFEIVSAALPESERDAFFLFALQQTVKHSYTVLRNQLVVEYQKKIMALLKDYVPAITEAIGEFHLPENPKAVPVVNLFQPITQWKSFVDDWIKEMNPDAEMDLKLIGVIMPAGTVSPFTTWFSDAPRSDLNLLAETLLKQADSELAYDRPDEFEAALTFLQDCLRVHDEYHVPHDQAEVSLQEEPTVLYWMYESGRMMIVQSSVLTDSFSFGKGSNKRKARIVQLVMRKIDIDNGKLTAVSVKTDELSVKVVSTN